MRAILKTNDPVVLSHACHLLEEAGIAHVVFDANISAVEGSIGIFPRRLMVAEKDMAQARTILAQTPVAPYLLPAGEQ